MPRTCAPKNIACKRTRTHAQVGNCARSGILRKRRGITKESINANEKGVTTGNKDLEGESVIVGAMLRDETKVQFAKRSRLKVKLNTK